MVGESRAGKTFAAIDLARALSQGSTFVTKRARAGGTLYVAVEAPGTIPGRLQAARLGPLEPFLDETGRDKSTGQEPKKLCVATLSNIPNLLTEDGRKQLVATARDVSEKMQTRFGIPLQLIAIDTMLAAFDIQDWNNPSETRRVMKSLAQISEETGTVVLGVHHHGKDVSRGAAGSYALTAAADFVLSVFADTDTDGGVSARRIALTKLRDGPTGWCCEFELKPFKIGVDDEGEDIVSAFVDPRSITAGFGKLGRSRTKKEIPVWLAGRFTKAVQEALEEFGVDRAIQGGAVKVRAVRIDDVRTSFARQRAHGRPTSGLYKGAEGRSGRGVGEEGFERRGRLALARGRVNPEVNRPQLV